MLGEARFPRWYSVAPLLFAGHAVVIAIHLDAWALRQEVLGLCARGHLRTMRAPVAAETSCPIDSCRWRRIDARASLRVGTVRHRRARRRSALTLPRCSFSIQFLQIRLLPCLCGTAWVALECDRTVEVALVNGRHGNGRKRGQQSDMPDDHESFDGCHRRSSLVTGRTSLRCAAN